MGEAWRQSAQLDSDVIVVGAGSAGALAAWRLAEAGLRVIVVERGPLAEAGARWVNGVSLHTLQQAGLLDDSQASQTFSSATGSPLVRAGSAPFHIYAGWGPKHLTTHPKTLLEVDMRVLTRQLQERAREAGARFQEGVSAHSALRQGDGGRLETSAGSLSARWLVDASGYAGAKLLARPRGPATQICAAAQDVFELADREAAARFCGARGAALGDTLCFTGIAGGYSIVNVRVHDTTVAVLTGSVPGAATPTQPIAGGAELLKRFVSAQPWIGARLFGGSRAIPLAPPTSPLCGLTAGAFTSDEPPVALVGDAARQVLALHGSGVGPGIQAALALAEVLTQGGNLWDYAYTWQRRWGGGLAASSAFAHFATSLAGGPDGGEIGELLDSGLLPPTMLAVGLDQTLRRPAWSELRASGRSILSKSAWTRRVAMLAAAMARLYIHYRRYPRKPADLPNWHRQRDAICKRAGMITAEGRS